MLVFRAVAASDVAAAEAQPQMDPGVAHFEALFASVAAGLNVANFLGVLAGLRHGGPPNLADSPIINSLQAKSILGLPALIARG